MKKNALHTVLVNSIYGPNCQFIKVDRKMKHHQRPLTNPYLCKIACLAPAVKKRDIHVQVNLVRHMLIDRLKRLHYTGQLATQVDVW